MQTNPLRMESIRQASWKNAESLGFKTNPLLPLLEKPDSTKSKDHIVHRIFAMLALAASSYGFDRKKAMNWLENEGGHSFLTKTEKEFLLGSQAAPKQFMEQIEAMWALCWAINVIPDLNFTKSCSGDFVKLLPDLKKMESGEAFRRKADLRNLQEIASNCDLVYCLSWSVRAEGIPVKFQKSIKPYVIEKRRHGLEWILSDEDWENIPLDT